MEGYRLTTKISAKGVIQLPHNPKLFDQEVETFIFSKEMPEEKKTSAVEFVNKWTGFLKEEDLEKANLNYLLEKYS